MTKFTFANNFPRRALLAACGALTLATIGDARPRKPVIPYCSPAQLDRLVKATSNHTLDVCAIQSRAWVCAESNRAQCCSVNNDGSLGHCSSSISFRTGEAGATLVPGAALPSKAPLDPLPIEASKPGVVPK